ncbi:DUF6965 family protein [Niabella sp. CJ426]|uniref:DUF6965 family protein n=1 Tax=Niabella sp. CJ426 TaxID=3393740 RepID=UPI003D042922
MRQTPSPQEIKLLEDYFKSVELPAQIKLNKAITVLDVPSFVQNCLNFCKDANAASVLVDPRYEDLVNLKAVLEEQSKVNG